jgi:hypothetical protein
MNGTHEALLELARLVELEAKGRSDADSAITKTIERLVDIVVKQGDRITELERKSKWPF